MICRPALGTLISAPGKKKKPFSLSLPLLDLEGEKGEKDKKGIEGGDSQLEEGIQGNKEKVLVVAPVSIPGIEGPGDMMGEVTKEKGETLLAALSTRLGETWGALGDRLSEIRRVEEKILGNTSEALGVVKTLKGKEDVEARSSEVRELGGALSQATKRVSD
ncbi:hypothetical protein AXF42_Ash021137 [Apostasia shenzhenica]|uniref:Uncharacterized protein n=1 Tax=Apostasia shenzhenica TaxID=1088818 RepID=A0A2I0AE16_9ASPA|nr:hypothetical protein AXF42_Ash021137 [Apostasia shenzhenica]